ncbi:glycerophosphodiester phosphodiesterase family protein [Sphingomonas sp. 1185]|uniref:glycerophosphodiester phosphodiesterase family protein n=1 Tax=Sphingomonas sp. 1185 TaxID=3156411 RepID=UPI00339652E2
MGFRLSSIIGLAWACLAVSTAHAATYNTDKIGNLLKSARTDMTLVCAHRGLHGTAVGTNSHQDWLRDVPENSVAAIQAAAAQGIECSEIDLRFDRHGNVAVLHDSNLGRTTNAYSAVSGATEYDPYTGRGYNPNTDQFPGETYKLALRKPSLSGYTNSRFTRLHDILSAVRDHRISMILLFDVKDVAVAKAAWEIVKGYKNAWGTPAERWVYFKMPVSSIGNTPADLERKGIFDASTEGGRFRLIPVFGADFIDASGGPSNALSNWQAYYDKGYVYATEVRLKQYDNSLSYPLNNIVNRYYGLRTTQRTTKILGAYQPVPETRNNTYFAADGHCCTEPKYWLWKSRHGWGQETADNRPDLNWLTDVVSGSFSYIITDDPITAISNLRNKKRRNTSVISN